VLAELDYLILKYAGVEAEGALIDEIDRGVYEIPEVRRTEWRDLRIMLERYADLRIGVADASLLIFADRYRTNEVLTLDQRRFRATRPPTFANFRILPFDPEPPPRMPRAKTSRPRQA
jgi:predicted nucleic acid-binding protein